MSWPTDVRTDVVSKPAPIKHHFDYGVGWVCTLPKEQTVAMAMLDEIHCDLPMPEADSNSYTMGSIGNHNIVIACLPKGKRGTSSAASVATHMARTFPSIEVVFLIGIGGGIPSRVRLGDVVISVPVDQYPGVVQWDMGKAEANGNFRPTGSLRPPPDALLTAVAQLESNHEMYGTQIPQYINELGEKHLNLGSRYTLSDSRGEPSLDKDTRNPGNTCVHYGLVASGNQSVHDHEVRDKLSRSFGGHVLCIEMEAAGVMDYLPCIVICGICNYADAEDNEDWEDYAAAVAAACAKELLQIVQPSDANEERSMKELLRILHHLRKCSSFASLLENR